MPRLQRVALSRGSIHHEVNELAARTRLVVAWSAADFQPADKSKQSSEVAALIDKFGLQGTTPQGLRNLVKDHNLFVASGIGENWAPTKSASEPIPGLHWSKDGLTTRWGGTVSVFKNGKMVLVAFDHIPQRLCDSADISRVSGGNSYVVACNGKLRAVADNSDWPVRAADLKPTAAAAEQLTSSL